MKGVQYQGKTKLIEVALKCGHLRFLPATLDKYDDERGIRNIMAILSAEVNPKFSSHIKVADLVRGAYRRLDKRWLSLEDTPLSSSLPRNIFSIGKNNVNHNAIDPPNIRWVSINPTGKKWPLKVIKQSIKSPNNKPYGFILVNQDMSHPDNHFEAYNDDGVYLGKMDKDTMLLYAEAIPYKERRAIPKSDA